MAWLALAFCSWGTRLLVAILPEHLGAHREFASEPDALLVLRAAALEARWKTCVQDGVSITKESFRARRRLAGGTAPATVATIANQPRFAAPLFLQVEALATLALLPYALDQAKTKHDLIGMNDWRAR